MFVYSCSERTPLLTYLSTEQLVKLVVEIRKH